MSELRSFDRRIGHGGLESADMPLPRDRRVSVPPRLLPIASRSTPSPHAQPCVAAMLAHARCSPRTSSARATARRRIEIPVLQGVELAIRRGRVRGDRRAQRLRQEHAAAPAGHARSRPTRAKSASKAIASTTCRRAGRDILRNKYFGMVFQFYHLLPELTTLENVLAAGDDRRGRARLLATPRRSIASARARCWSWSALAIG